MAQRKKTASRKPGTRRSKARPARRRTAPRRRRPPRRGGSGFWRLTRLTLTTAIWGSIAAAAALIWFAWDLPDLVDLDAASTRRPTITFLAADGSEILRAGDVFGDPVTLEQLPAFLPRAVLATEDRRFYRHFGIDLVGIARAMATNLRAGGIRQGGSTITQQLAKNLFLTPDRTIRRKVQEVMLALWLESNFSKDQILTIYLNRIYLGAGTFGVDAAARAYFGKPVPQVGLFEAAVLAGLAKAPTRLNPRAAPERAARRANTVLDNMVAAGWLDPATADAARRDRVATVRRIAGGGAADRYFTDWAMARATDLVGRIDRDLVVQTTLDPRLQAAAAAATRQTLDEAKGHNISQAALVALKRDGAVAALVGGRDWRASAFNRATQARRQPGSAFKAVVYLAALETGFTPDSRVQDLPQSVEGWSPKNAGGEHRGAMTLREGLARSSNAVAVALAEELGRTQVIDMARRLGFTAPMDPVPSLPLGVFETSPLELAAAYAILANEGRDLRPYGIVSIADTAGTRYYTHQGEPGTRVVEARHVRALNAMLWAAVSWGTGKNAKLDRPAAGKTGTTQDHRDAWFAGYTGAMTAVVWMGNDDGAPMKGVTGGSFPAHLWRRFMLEAAGTRPGGPLPGVAAGG